MKSRQKEFALHPSRILAGAKGYQGAADSLYQSMMEQIRATDPTFLKAFQEEVIDPQGRRGFVLNSKFPEGLELRPIYLLYSYAIELALKAYISAKRGRHGGFDKTHKLDELYKDARAEGFVVQADYPLDIDHCVKVLTAADLFHNLRYWTGLHTGYPELTWTHQTTADIVSAVQKYVNHVPTSEEDKNPFAWSVSIPRPSSLPRRMLIEVRSDPKSKRKAQKD